MELERTKRAPYQKANLEREANIHATIGAKTRSISCSNKREQVDAIVSCSVNVRIYTKN
jgi:hypothetical protein